MPRADIQVAIAFGHALKFPLFHKDQHNFPVSIIEHAKYPPLDPTISGDRSNGQDLIFTKLRQLIVGLESSMIPIEALRSHFDIVDDLILQHLYQNCVGLCHAEKRSLALATAAQVFMYVALRRFPNSPLVRTMCSRLQDIVGSFTPEIWIGHQPALMWIAFTGLLGTGGVAAGARGEGGEWFLNLYLSTIQGYLDGPPLSKNRIRNIFSSFLWDESSCGPLVVWLEKAPGRAQIPPKPAGPPGI
jgi:hypothetical protein